MKSRLDNRGGLHRARPEAASGSVARLRRRIPYVVFALVVLLAGCGKRLSGRYEARPEIPQMRMPGVDAKVLRQMDPVMKMVQDMNRMTLEFDGSMVRMGTATAISEYRYRVSGNKLEVISEAMGQKTIMPMTIEADGSISYLTLRFYKTP